MIQMTSMEQITQHIDAVDCFKNDVKSRKSLVPSASKKPKKTGCTLPSDYLTSSQKKKMNGNVVSINLNSPMRYEEFKTLPDDLKVEYLNKIIHMMGATIPLLAEMMGISQSKATFIIKEYGIKSHYRGYRIPNKELSQWNEFVKPIRNEESKIQKENRAESKISIRLDTISITINGSTWKEIGEAIAQMDCPIPDNLQISIRK